MVKYFDDTGKTFSYPSFGTESSRFECVWLRDVYIVAAATCSVLFFRHFEGGLCQRRKFLGARPRLNYSTDV